MASTRLVSVLSKGLTWHRRVVCCAPWGCTGAIIGPRGQPPCHSRAVQCARAKVRRRACATRAQVVRAVRNAKHARSMHG